MADIVQLVENGVKKFIKTHAKAVEGLTEEVNSNVLKVSSSNAKLSLGFSTYTPGSEATLEKTGNSVSLSGVLKNASTIASGATVVMGVIDEGFRPLRFRREVCHGSGNSKYLLTIRPSGELVLERYETGGVSQAVPAGAFLTITGEWPTK